MNDAQFAAFQEVVRGLRESIDRLVEQGRKDHDLVTALSEQVRQAFIEIKSLKAQVAALVTASAPSEESIRKDEQHQVRCAAMVAKIASLEASREIVKSETISAGKTVLVWFLKIVGLGGGAVVVARLAQAWEHLAK